MDEFNKRKNTLTLINAYRFFSLYYDEQFDSLCMYDGANLYEVNADDLFDLVQQGKLPNA